MLDAEVQTAKKPIADENLRHVMLQCLSTQGNENVLKYAIAEKILKAGQSLEEWPLDQVAIGEGQIRTLQTKIAAHFAAKAPAKSSWQDFKIPFGKDECKPLGSLRKIAVLSYWTDLTSPALLKAHPEFRKALDAAGRYFKFEK